MLFVPVYQTVANNVNRHCHVQVMVISEYCGGGSLHKALEHDSMRAQRLLVHPFHLVVSILGFSCRLSPPWESRVTSVNKDSV
jgi:hypothetical protein